MIESGTVDSVRVETLGSFLTADAASAATQITVDDIADFSEDGGWLLINGQVIEYSAADDDTGIILLADGLDTAGTDGDRVDAYANGSAATQMIADVYLGDADDTVEVSVPIGLRDRVYEGQESALAVRVDTSTDEFFLIDILGADPVVDLSYSNPSTPLPVDNQTDGVAPDESPIPEGTGLQRQIIAKVDGIANHDPVTYYWHISNSNAAPPPAFDDGDSLVSFGGNTMFVYTAATDGPLEYDTDYFLGTFAWDADGPGPFSGWSDAVRLNPAASDDIAVGAIRAAKIDVVDLMASGIRTSESGARVELSTEDGFTVFDSTEKTRVSFPTSSDDLKINADLIAQSLTVEGDMSLRGTSHVLERGKSLSLAASVSSPLVAPTVVPVLPTLEFASDAYRPPGNRRGFAWYSSKWWIGYTFLGGGFVSAFNPTTGALTGDQFSLPAGLQPESICHVTNGGTQRWVILCTDASGTRIVLVTDDSGTEITRWTTSSRACAVAADGTGLVVALDDRGPTPPSNVFTFYPYTLAGVIGSPLAWTYSGTVDGDSFDGFYVGNGDYGAKRYIVAMRDLKRTVVLSASGSTLSEATNTGWLLSASERVAGIVYDGTNFWTASRVSNNISKYGDWNKTSGDYGWFRYSYYDADATGGTHETALSPSIRKAISFGTRRRCWQVTAPAIPDLGGTDDPDTLRVYYAQHASSEPSNTGYYLQGSATSTPTLLVTSMTLSGTAAPSSNNFPSAVPAKITNSSGGTLLSGDDFPWTTYTPTLEAGGTINLGSGGTLVGRYRKIAGQIEVEITLTWGGSGRSTGSGSYAFTLPVIAAQVRQTIGRTMSFNGTASVDAGLAYSSDSDSIAPLDKAGARLTPTNPYTWTTNAEISVCASYRPA